MPLTSVTRRKVAVRGQRESRRRVNVAEGRGLAPADQPAHHRPPSSRAGGPRAAQYEAAAERRAADLLRQPAPPAPTFERRPTITNEAAVPRAHPPVAAPAPDLSLFRDFARYRDRLKLFAVFPDAAPHELHGYLGGWRWTGSDLPSGYPCQGHFCGPFIARCAAS